MSNCEITNATNGGAHCQHKYQSELMSRKEAAAYLGVSEITLAIWKSTGRYALRCYKIGRLAKYKRSELDAFIASRIQA